MPPRWECCKPWRNFRAHSTVTQPSWKFLVAQAFLPVSVRRKRRADSDVGVPKFDADRNVCATFVTASRRAHGQNPARYRTDRAEPGECPVHLDLSTRCHGPRDACHECPVAGVRENTRRVPADRHGGGFPAGRHLAAARGGPRMRRWASDSIMGVCRPRSPRPWTPGSICSPTSRWPRSRCSRTPTAPPSGPR